MDELYAITRSIYLMWGILLFWYMVYWGIQDIMVGRRCGHVQVPPEHYLFAFASLAAAFVVSLSIGEILLTDAPGGYRVFLPVLFLLPASAGSWQGAFRIRMHRLAISLGACKGGHTHDDV